MNRQGHLGRVYHFLAESGDPLHASDPTEARLFLLLASGVPAGIRGIPAAFLQKACQISVIAPAALERICAASDPMLGQWGREVASRHRVITQLPITRGAATIGLQLRGMRLSGNAADHAKEIRTLGRGDGLFIPSYRGWNPAAVVIHEGPWGAACAMWDARNYGSRDIFSVAILHAGIPAFVVQDTLDLIFPGVPCFSLMDQDPAGVAARAALLSVAKPILITGAGPGKDYRDLIEEVRFERLSEILRAELRKMEGQR